MRSGLFVLREAVFPSTPGDGGGAHRLATLSHDDTLFHCARANMIISGHSGLDVKKRKQVLLTMLCTHEEIDRINTFGVWRAPSFFRCRGNRFP